MFRERRVEPPRITEWTAFPNGQSRRTGRPWIWCGGAWCLLVVGVCVHLNVLIFLGDTRGAAIVLTPAAVVVSGPAYVMGLNLRRHGRRHLARVLDSPGAVGDEPFVLYLRSFVDDARLDVPQERPSMPALTKFLIAGRSEEEQIARAVRRIGRLVAVGEPGERLPYAGADRVHLPLDDWQEPVSDLIGRARLVVLSAGTSKGTLWELQECMRLLPPKRLVVLVPLESEAMRIGRAPFFRDMVHVALKYALAPSADRLSRGG
ncbi:hypothetical protein M1L60_35185 [Actinoplanes sp. TRM 88003]|uniref:DUF218 domain-containing protein n=1 Tax=Paractinoplanes aksuensis TaxID=2939490 RepID=A0ABT1DYA1_9ACTN|nr:hypothetical protein [Actinoplanes aksuensis]MCO8275838.1 hypothetical protein [Actinoplanes aksuensis]